MDQRQEGADKQRKTEAEERALELNDLGALLKLVEGRRFIWRMIELAGPLREAYTGNSNTFYNLGKQAFGRMTFGDILQFYPQEFILMQQEANIRKEERERKYGKST